MIWFSEAEIQENGAFFPLSPPVNSDVMPPDRHVTDHTQRLLRPLQTEKFNHTLIIHFPVSTAETVHMSSKFTPL